MKIGLFFQEITFITEFPGSNFLLPTLLTGGKWDFQVADLLLATVNFEPWCGLKRIGKNLFILQDIGKLSKQIYEEQTTEAANLEDNKAKNRWVNILPCK